MTRSEAPDIVHLAAIGLGRWANVMARAYAGSELVDLRACFTRNSDRRRRFAADFGCEQEASLTDLLAREDIDGVVVTVPNEEHATVIEEAAAYGKHVYVEKPLAVDPGHIRRISQAVSKSGILFACGHSARRLAGLREMRRRIENGTVGVPSMVEAVFSNERGLELKESDWRGDPSQSPGGPLTQLAIHQIDNVQYLLGRIRTVTAVGRSMVSAARNTMVAGALVEFDDALGYLGCNWLTPGAFSLDLYGTRARLHYDLDFTWWSKSAVSDQHSRLLQVTVGKDSADPDNRLLNETAIEMVPGNHLREEIEEFALAIRGKAEIEVDLTVAVANMAVVLAAARSMSRGAVVEVEEVLKELA